MKTLRNHLAYVAVAGAFAVAAPALANHPAANPNLGTPVHEGSADRTVVIEPGAKWVNVNRNETVRFVVGGKSFTWRFDTLNQSAVALDKIAPAGLLDRPIKAYVGPDPMHDLS